MHVPPAAAPPGHAKPAQSPYRTLAITCLVVAGLDVVHSLYKIGTVVLGLVMWQLGPARYGPSGTGSLETSMVKIWGWDGARYLLFVAASTLLIVIGMRLLRGHASALVTAYHWAFGALAVLACSLAIQLFVMLPLQREMLDSFGGPPSPGSDSADQFLQVFFLLGPVLSTLFMVVWPVVLLWWVSDLRKRQT